jgi:CheY-like chemotaxis protein
VLVLVVEDDDAIRETVGELLEGEGYACWLEPDADAALRRVERDEALVRVILLDLMMPGMSSASFVEHVRQRPACAETRIVLMTAATESAVPGDLDVDGVLLKPFSVEQLLEMVAAAAGHTPPPFHDRHRHVAR